MVVIMYDSQVERFEPFACGGWTILRADDGCKANYE
jgi:hypothetical protein